MTNYAEWTWRVIVWCVLDDSSSNKVHPSVVLSIIELDYMVVKFNYVKLCDQYLSLFKFGSFPCNFVESGVKHITLTPFHGEMYSIKFVTYLQLVRDLLQLLCFAPPIKLTATIWIKLIYCLIEETPMTQLCTIILIPTAKLWSM